MNKDLPVESRENINVILRIRPIINKESEDKADWISVDRNTIFTKTLKNEIKQFTYDYIAPQNSTQLELFENCAKSICDSSWEGYNGTIFAYGQTSSGKTYTLLGPSYSQSQSNNNGNSSTINSNSFIDNDYKAQNNVIDEHTGLLPRIIHYLFKAIKDKETTFSFSCSFLEIYNEQMSDLLTGQCNKTWTIRDVANTITVDGWSKLKISSADEAWSLVLKGTKLRHIAPTMMNQESSRSHAVFSIYIENSMKEKGKVKTIKSVFHIIDLAGSERQRATETVGNQIKEAANINKSLMHLNQVIRGWTETNPVHIHYRDSKWTHLLKDSLGGNAKTAIIANISPANCNNSETINTLKFAQTAKMIKNKAVINEELTGAETIFKDEIKKLKTQYNQIKEENTRLKSEIENSKRHWISKAHTDIIDNVEQDIESMIKDWMGKEEDLKKYQQDNEILQDKMQKYELDLTLKEKECNEYKMKLHKEKEDTAAWQSQLKDYALRDAYLTQQFQQLENNTKQMELSLKNQIERLNNTITDNKSTLSIKENVIANINNDIKTYLSIIAQKDIKINETLQELENYKLNNSQWVKEKTDILNNTTIHTSVIEDIKNKLDSALKALAKKEEELEIVKHQRSDVVNKYDAEIKWINQSKNEILVKHQEWIKKFNELSIVKDEIKFENTSIYDKLKRVHEQWAIYWETIRILRYEKNDLVRNNITLKEENKKLENVVDIYKSSSVFSTTQSVGGSLNNNNNNNKNVYYSKMKQENTKLKEEWNDNKKNYESWLKMLKNNKKENTKDLIQDLAKKDEELNSIKGIMHSSILNIKEVLNKNSINSNNPEQSFIEGKSFEEKFKYYLEAWIEYIGDAEVKEKMLQEENIIKEKQISLWNREISIISNVSDFKWDNNNNNNNNYISPTGKVFMNKVNTSKLKGELINTKKRKFTQFEKDNHCFIIESAVKQGLSNITNMNEENTVRVEEEKEENEEKGEKGEKENKVINIEIK